MLSYMRSVNSLHIMKAIYPLVLVGLGCAQARHPFTLPIHMSRISPYKSDNDARTPRPLDPRATKMQVPMNHQEFSGSGPLGLPIAVSSLFLPSVDHNEKKHFTLQLYNSTESSTYLIEGTRTYTHYVPLYIAAYGVEGFDTLTLPFATSSTGESLTLKNQSFTELKYYESSYEPGTNFFDGVLGLSFGKSAEKAMNPWQDSARPDNLLSPFRTMVESNALEANQFTLQLPLNTTSPGHLTFGSAPAPPINSTTHVLFPPDTETWSIEAHSVQLNTSYPNSEPYTLLNASLANHPVVLMTNYPCLAFPDSLAQAIRAELPIQRSPCDGTLYIPCSSVPHLPEIALRVGERTIVLRGEDYTLRFKKKCRRPEEVVEECVPLIEELPQVLRPGWDPEDRMILMGSAVLRRFEVGFDWDGRRVAPLFHAQVPLLLLPVPSNSSHTLNSTFNSTSSFNTTISTDTDTDTDSATTNFYKTMIILKSIHLLLRILRLMLDIRKSRLQKAKKNGAEALEEICRGLEEDCGLLLEWSGEKGITSCEWEARENRDEDGDGDIVGRGEEEKEGEGLLDEKDEEGGNKKIDEGDFLIDIGEVEERSGL
ncbi:Saccharopepsin protein [Rutstroemia sp. NJR-2017a BVV2]|nr:Saccharopepsin protein [Rutstroemia sp. NJR-2017a BVV2]